MTRAHVPRHAADRCRSRAYQLPALLLAPQVRKTPSCPRNWVNSSLLYLYSHRNVLTCIFWANLTPFTLQLRGVLAGAFFDGDPLGCTVVSFGGGPGFDAGLWIGLAATLWG